MADCQCPDRDEQLRKIAYDPKSYVAFKWCRKCDKHYARCKCEQPEFYAILRGKEIDVSNGLQSLAGNRVAPDLTKR